MKKHPGQPAVIELGTNRVRLVDELNRIEAELSNLALLLEDSQSDKIQAVLTFLAPISDNLQDFSRKFETATAGGNAE